MVPCIIVLTVTFVKGFSYADMLEIGLHLFNVLIKDAERLVIIGASIVLVILAYLNRTSIYRMLGIEDSNVFHFQWRDLIEPGWRSKTNIPFQVCVWKVTAKAEASKDDFHTTAHNA